MSPPKERAQPREECALKSQTEGTHDSADAAGAQRGQVIAFPGLLAVTNLIGSINMLHIRACKSARDALESARLCGELLIEAKQKVGHGVWAIWMSKNITFSSRTATRYMQIAEGWEQVMKLKSDTVSDLTLSGALRALRPPQNDKDGEEEVDELKWPARSSRARRWTEATQQATNALEELIGMQEEFQSWRDNLPENFTNSALAEKLDTLLELDLQGALKTVSEADAADLPWGFGRD